MKKRSFALAMAFVLTLVLTGCSAVRESNTMQPSHSVPGYDSDVRDTDGIDDGNDAFQGGGAGGTNDRDNDGRPDSVTDTVDDIGRDADDVIRDAGDAIGDAVDDVGRAMH